MNLLSPLNLPLMKVYYYIMCSKHYCIAETMIIVRKKMFGLFCAYLTAYMHNSLSSTTSCSKSLYRWCKNDKKGLVPSPASYIYIYIYIYLYHSCRSNSHGLKMIFPGNFLSGDVYFPVISPPAVFISLLFSLTTALQYLVTTYYYD